MVENWFMGVKKSVQFSQDLQNLNTLISTLPDTCFTFSQAGEKER